MGGPFEAPHLNGQFVCGEEALDAQLLERDVVRRAEGGQGREVSQHEIALAELDRQEWRGRGVQVERAPLPRRVRIRQQLLEQRARLGVREAGGHVPVQPLDERGRRGLPVHDPRPERLRVKHEAHRVGRPERGHRGGVEEERLHARAALVDLQHVPVAIEDERGVGLLLAQDEIERAARLRQGGGIEARRAVDRGVAGRREEIVAVTERHVERAREQDDHLAARRGPAGLDEAQMTRRHARLDRQIELTHAATRTPLAQQPADPARLDHFLHGADSSIFALRWTLPVR